MKHFNHDFIAGASLICKGSIYQSHRLILQVLDLSNPQAYFAGA
jgi:hypothetical protein